MGQVEQNIARQCYLAGEPLPERIANAPELKQGLNFYLQTFFDLDSERHNGFKVGAIPWSSIKLYASHYELDKDETEDLLYIIRRMDSEHLKRVNKDNG